MINTGSIVVVVKNIDEDPDLNKHPIGVIVDYPDTVPYEGTALHVLIDGEICRVFRENVYLLDTLESLSDTTCAG